MPFAYFCVVKVKELWVKAEIQLLEAASFFCQLAHVRPSNQLERLTNNLRLSATATCAAVNPVHTFVKSQEGEWKFGHEERQYKLREPGAVLRVTSCYLSGQECVARKRTSLAAAGRFYNCSSFTPGCRKSRANRLAMLKAG